MGQMMYNYKTIREHGYERVRIKGYYIIGKALVLGERLRYRVNDSQLSLKNHIDHF